MANKRIELEQYRCYVNLFDEEPNRKKVRKGVATTMVAATLLVVLFFVLGLLSGNLARNPKNVLEKPPAAASTPQDTTPGVNIPGQEGGQLPPGVEMPVQQEGGQLPPGVPQPGSFLPGGTAGDLLAQAEGVEVPVQAEPTGVPVQIDPAASPGVPASTGPAVTAPPVQTEDGKKPAKKGPPKETKGIGNLSSLATKVSGRGFQIYMLFFTIILGVVIYLTLKRAYKEGKAR